MKIVFVAESGIYDYWLETFKRHTKHLAKAISVRTADLDKTRLDFADVIIYFDNSRAHFYSHIAINLEMVNHAAKMGIKGIKSMIVTKNGNPGEVVYRIWYSGSTLTEMGQIAETCYAFHSNKVGPKVENNEGFNFIDLAEFEKQFIVPKQP